MLGKRLHTLGAFAYSHPWRFVAGWVVLIAILGLLAAHFIQPTSAAISIPGTAAQKAIDRANELFPNSGKGSGRIVFKAGDGKKIADYTAQITDLTTKIGAVDGISTAVNPFIDASFISKSGTIAYGQVQFKNANGSIPAETLSKVLLAVDAARTNGLQIETAGDLISHSPGEILGVGEISGVILALVVLFITLGSLIAAGMPIITALAAIGVSMAGLFSLSQAITINATTPVLAVMLGLAVGIDYSLFIINKYRRLALDGYNYKDAAAKAIGSAGNAVIFAALTVVIALSALSIVNVPFMTLMGLTGAATIAVAAMVSISLVPAMLGIAGRRVFNKKTRAKVEAAQLLGAKKIHSVNTNGIWYKWGTKITSHPIIALVISVIIIGVIALPVKDLQLGLPTDQYAAASTTQKKAYDLLTEGFGVGFNAPLTVVVEGLPTVTDADKAAVRTQLITTSSKQATAPQKLNAAQQAAAAAKLEATVEQYAKLVQLSKVAANIAKINNVDQAVPAVATANGTAGIIQVIPKTAPIDPATADLIKTLRDSSEQKTITGSNTISLAVTGSTALQGDINSKLGNALPEYLIVVVGLSLILLIVAFRSILVPIKATIGFLLSVLAMFGSLVAVFQWGWFGLTDAPGPIISFIPIISIGIVFGLAMDYEFFLVSSMHEAYTQSKRAKDAVVQGFGVGSKVVTAAAIIMISVFAGFITNHDATIQAIGFGLAVGILVDAFLVRMTIVPAVMTLLGKSAWWIPEWLDKRLPHVSIEGEE
ncbi:MAG TPA: MMPL family transporter [Candidatus Microsaccharimonas sp.]|jgi:RND superfamily putative drug exporter